MTITRAWAVFVKVDLHFQPKHWFTTQGGSAIEQKGSSQALVFVAAPLRNYFSKIQTKQWSPIFEFSWPHIYRPDSRNFSDSEQLESRTLRSYIYFISFFPTIYKSVSFLLNFFGNLIVFYTFVKICKDILKLHFINILLFFIKLVHSKKIFFESTRYFFDSERHFFE